MVVKVNSYVCEISVSGSQSEELIRRVQQMMQQIVQEMAPDQTDVQMSLRKECDIAVDWSELEADVLVRIAENHLLLPEDFVMFSSVCRSWHCAAAACNLVKLNKKWIHKQMPWVMLTDGEIIREQGGYTISNYILPQVLNDIEVLDNDVVNRSDYVYDYVRCVLRLGSTKSLKIFCPEAYGRVCWGSGHGWIVTAGGDGVMTMSNPFTKSRVGLPSFGTFLWRWDDEDEVCRNLFITKAVVLDVGGDGFEDLRVVAFYGNDHVAIVKPGNRRWVEIEGEARTNSPLMDVTYDSKLGLIFVDNAGGLLCCSVPEKEESPFLKWFQPPAVESTEFNNSGRRGSSSYIVKCGADLLLVTRLLDFDDDPNYLHASTLDGRFFVDYYMTSHFWVHKYEFDKKTWVLSWTLKDVALFVGNNTSMWVPEPGDGCIYFNDDQRRMYAETKYKLGGHDCGVFRLNGLEAFHTGSQVERTLYGGSDNRSGHCCPFFFKPSICISKGFN